MGGRAWLASLRAAIKDGDAQEVLAWWDGSLRDGANLDAPDEWGETVLHCAASAGGGRRRWAPGSGRSDGADRSR